MASKNEEDSAVVMPASADEEAIEEEEQEEALLLKTDEKKEGGEEATPSRYFYCIGRNHLGSFVRLLVFAILVLYVVGVFSDYSIHGSKKGAAHRKPTTTSEEPYPFVFQDPREDASFPNLTTVAYTAERFKAILEWLVDHGISARQDLEQDGSPQARACHFMATQDITLPTAAASKSNRTEYTDYLSRYVLAVFYYSTNGSQWQHGLNFLSETHHCQWMEILQYPDGSSEYLGVRCDTHTRKVKALFTSNTTLAGHIPNELGLLTTLATIDLDDNFLTGTIPQKLAVLPELENFFASQNELRGEIPSSWTTKIRNINLSNNSLTGPFVLDSHMEELEGLALDHNHLTGKVILDKKRFPKLQQVFLNHNYFTGSLVENKTLASQTLEYIDVSHNMIQGSIPAHFLNNLPKLLVLNLGHNDFTGRVPEVLQENTQLGLLAMSRLNLSTPQRLPSSIGNLKVLEDLDLSNTLLAGPVPEEWGKKLTQLKRLFLATTDCEGQRLDWLQEFHSLEEVSLKDTWHVGTIPDLSHLVSLTLLDLDSGGLTGTIPATLGTLSKLRFLILSGNYFTGEVPTSVLELPELDLLSLERNENLGGSICHNSAPVIVSKETVLSADCQVCPCCDQCCATEDWRCHYDSWVPNYDPDWRAGFKRQEFVFGVNVTFPVESKRE